MILMDRSSVIFLVKQERTQKTDYTWSIVEKKREIYCDVRSITQTEWFEAGRNGIDHPAYIFDMNRNEYEDEQIVEYNGQRYGVFRVYMGKNESLELHCEAKGGLWANADEWEQPTEPEVESDGEV